MSMLAETCATRKPVHMFDLHTGPECQWPALEPLLGEEVRHTSWRRWSRRFKPQPLIYRAAMAVGPNRMTRDVRIIQRALIEARRAMWLGEPFPPGPPPPPLEDVARAVAHVKALFTGPEARQGSLVDAAA
jgi:hypothetical protein